MTEGVLSEDELAGCSIPRRSARRCSRWSATTRRRATILCAGAGHFARANVTLTQGFTAGAGDGAGQQVISHWNEVTDRAGEIVPDYGFAQSEREIASAGRAAA